MRRLASRGPGRNVRRAGPARALVSVHFGEGGTSADLTAVYFTHIRLGGSRKSGRSAAFVGANLVFARPYMGEHEVRPYRASEDGDSGLTALLAAATAVRTVSSA